MRPNTSSCCQANSAAFSAAVALETTRNHFFHDLVGAAINALHARVGEQPAHQVFIHIAVAAVQVYAFIEHLLLHVTAPPLGHRRGFRVQLSSDEIHD